MKWCRRAPPAPPLVTFRAVKRVLASFTVSVALVSGAAGSMTQAPHEGRVTTQDSLPATTEPTTVPATASVPTTEVPTTEVPTTTTTEVPTTEVPTTEVPTTTTTVLRARDVRILTRLPVKERVVFITIDDGGTIPDSLVEFLNRERIPVTSFVMPEPLLWQLRQYRRIKKMTFENHSNTHGHMRRMTFAEQKEEICRANRLVGRMAHSKPVFFRPPGGDWNETTRRAAAACGIRYLVLWNVIADDEIIRMRSSHVLMPGDIILMHYRKKLIPSLRWVMAQLRHDGLRPALMRDFARYGRP